MAKKQSNKHQSIQLFKNPLVEKLTHVHPITPLIVWVPFISWMIFRVFAEGRLDAWSIGGLMAGGLFFWSLFEYIAHRFVFHFEGKDKVSKYIVYLFHGIHHEDPADPSRLVMPPVAGILIALPVFCLFQFVLGSFLVKPFFAGFLMGYLCYDYTHFAIHHFTPKTPFGRFLKQYHMTHHFVAPHTRFGVSSPLWDYVFSTVEKEQPKASQSSS